MGKVGNPNMRVGAPSVNKGSRKPKLSTAGETIAQIIGRISPGAEEEIMMIHLAAKGILKDPHLPDTFIRVDSKSRITAAVWIAEQLHGKPKQAVDVDLSGAIEHRQAIDLGLLEQTELGTLERLLDKVVLPEPETVDFIPVVPQELPAGASAPATPDNAEGE